MWTSSKIASIEPQELRTHYAWLLPLALANGAFEADPALVRSRAYSFCFPWMSVDQVSSLLDEFERRKLLFRWKLDGKLWGYWIGIEKAGRLPGPSRQGKHEKIGPEPDRDELQRFVENNTDLNGIQKLLGFGSGFGFGSGLGSGSGSKLSDDSLLAPNGKKTTVSAKQPKTVKPAVFFQGQILSITEEQHASYRRAYPALDCPKAYSRMDSWLLSNPGRRPRKNLSRFAHNWLQREQTASDMAATRRRGPVSTPAEFTDAELEKIQRTGRVFS